MSKQAKARMALDKFHWAIPSTHRTSAEHPLERPRIPVRPRQVQQVRVRLAVFLLSELMCIYELLHSDVRTDCALLKLTFHYSHSQNIIFTIIPNGDLIKL